MTRGAGRVLGFACARAHHPQTCCSAPCSLVLASLRASLRAACLRGQVGVVVSLRHRRCVTQLSDLSELRKTTSYSARNLY